MLDVFLENPIDFQSAYSKRKNLPVEDFTISLAGVVDLITMKRIAGREQDSADIAALTRLLQLDEEGSS